MVFSSTEFLFCFLPFTILVHFAIPRRCRNYFLLMVSLFFYAWGEYRHLPLMLSVIALNYICALLVCALHNTQLARRIVFITGIILNIGVLVVYKYLGFLAININRLFNASITVPSIALPIGISFFTFQAMSYLIDVYRGTVIIQRNFFHLALYISFFPQLIAGPIVRYSTINDQIIQRSITMDLFTEGVKRFIAGLGKKVILANGLAMVADAAFTASQPSMLFAWLGAVCYSFQILFDFSGYSEMAIGLAKMFGFVFPDNFNYPYISKTITEFWRRWHISLGTWFRDYVYFPMGGSRVNGRIRLVFNLFVVWALTGIWHGAQWHFIVWGLFYFVLLTFEKLGHLNRFLHITSVAFIYRIITLLCVVVGWVLFRADSITHAVQYLTYMFGLTKAPFIDHQAIFYLQENIVLIIFAVIFSTPIFKLIKNNHKRTNKLRIIIYCTLETVAPLCIFLLCVSYLVTGTHNPFIYFNF